MFAHHSVLYISKECFWIQAMKVLFFFFNHTARNQKADNPRTGSMIQPDGNVSWGPGIFLFSDSWSEIITMASPTYRCKSGRSRGGAKKGNDFFLMLFCVFKEKVFLELPWKLLHTALWTELIGKGGWGSRNLTFSVSLWEAGERKGGWESQLGELNMCQPQVDYKNWNSMQACLASKATSLSLIYTSFT